MKLTHASGISKCALETPYENKNKTSMVKSAVIIYEAERQTKKEKGRN